MIIQMYYINLSKQPGEGEAVVGAPIFEDNFHDSVIGFIFDYKKDTNVAGMCLFNPKKIFEDDIPRCDFLYYEERVDYNEYLKKMYENNPDCREEWEEFFKEEIDNREEME